MPELILLAVVSLSAMMMLVFLFLKLNQSQTTLIRLLTASNQTLINQARTSELTSLAGLNQMTGVASTYTEDETMSVDAREMQAWQQMVAAKGIGEELYDEDLMAMRSEL